MIFYTPTQFDMLANDLGLADKDIFIQNIERLATINEDAKNLLKYIKKLQSKNSVMRKGLAFKDFKNELLHHYDSLAFVLVFCVEMYKDFEQEEDSTEEEYEYLYRKYKEDYDKFIVDIEYLVLNIEGYIPKYHKKHAKPVVHRDMTVIPKVPYMPI